MIKERDFEGKDLNEALHVASDAMGIPEPELDYEIIEQGRRGLFGVGAKSVRIRVMPPLSQPADPMAAAELKLPRDQLPKRGDRKPAPARKRSRQESRPVRKPPQRSSQKPVRKPAPKPEAAPTPQASEVAGTLQRMLEMMGMDLTASAADSDNGVAIELDGPDRKVLMQKDSELLSALQFLLNRMSRRTWPDVGRIRLSCDGHRKRRDEDLVELTREVAQQVRSTGRTKRLHPMNAYERRLVHLTVREFEQLGSRSEGNGHLKRVKIFKQASA